jgi:glycosyltransferase involved in cell wall biosynthesis
MRRLGAAGHDHVQEAFSWRAHVDRLEAVYRELC